MISGRNGIIQTTLTAKTAAITIGKTLFACCLSDIDFLSAPKLSTVAGILKTL